VIWSLRAAVAGTPHDALARRVEVLGPALAPIAPAQF
jgi:hypothetical protein